MIHWRPSNILKTSKKTYEVQFFNTQKYIYSESKSIYILKVCTLYIEIKYKRYKNFLKITALFFLLRASTHHSFIFNQRFLYELKHRVRLSKSMCRIFYFRLHFIFVKVYFFVYSKILKSIDICVSWSSPKLYLRMNFLDLENRRFQNGSFAQ